MKCVAQSLLNQTLPNFANFLISPYSASDVPSRFIPQTAAKLFTNASARVGV